MVSDLSQILSVAPLIIKQYSDVSVWYLTIEKANLFVELKATDALPFPALANSKLDLVSTIS
jgi:tRNA threonylcarbamoyladenosine modification (KEOPS) complex  Pcc1 subunit